MDPEPLICIESSTKMDWVFEHRYKNGMVFKGVQDDLHVENPIHAAFSYHLVFLHFLVETGTVNAQLPRSFGPVIATS